MADRTISTEDIIEILRADFIWEIAYVDDAINFWWQSDLRNVTIEANETVLRLNDDVTFLKILSL